MMGVQYCEEQKTEQGRCRPSMEGFMPVELERFAEGRIGTMQKSRVWQARQPVEAALLGLL